MDGAAEISAAANQTAYYSRGHTTAYTPDEKGGGSLQPLIGSRRLKAWIFAIIIVSIVAWAVTSLIGKGPAFAMLVSDRWLGVEEATSAVARLFAAMVLGLFLAREVGWRMYWIAGGLMILGLGHLIFGYVEPLIQSDPPELKESLYEGFVTRTFACALFMIGLFPGRPPRLLKWAAIAIPMTMVIGYVYLFELMDGEDWMPVLSYVDTPNRAVRFSSPLSWLTPWHWVLSALPLALAAIPAAGAFRWSRSGLLPDWLLLAMTLMAGSLLHEYLWPSAYGGDVLTTADILSLASAVVVAVGGAFELRRIAEERTTLLAHERQRVRSLGEIATLKADFSAMVAHELGAPVAAIRQLNEMLSSRGANPEIRRYATNAIENETASLSALLADVRTAASVERDDFRVEIRPLSLTTLLGNASAYANTLPGDHPIKVCVEMLAGGYEEASKPMLADPERIGQVLRNLLSNAAKYSPDGVPIELRARATGQGRILIEVADHGPGIHPRDLSRIFDKFGRGRGQRETAGVGLGLYLSRRIVQSHGSDLTVHSTPGSGSVFGFELEVSK